MGWLGGWNINGSNNCWRQLLYKTISTGKVKRALLGNFRRNPGRKTQNDNGLAPLEHRISGSRSIVNVDLLADCIGENMKEMNQRKTDKIFWVLCISAFGFVGAGISYYYSSKEKTPERIVVIGELATLEEDMNKRLNILDRRADELNTRLEALKKETEADPDTVPIHPDLKKVVAAVGELQIIVRELKARREELMAEIRRLHPNLYRKQFEDQDWGRGYHRSR